MRFARRFLARVAAEAVIIALVRAGPDPAWLILGALVLTVWNFLSFVGDLIAD